MVAVDSVVACFCVAFLLLVMLDGRDKLIGLSRRGEGVKIEGFSIPFGVFLELTLMDLVLPSSSQFFIFYTRCKFYSNLI